MIFISDTREDGVDQRLRISLDHLLEGVQIVDREWRYLYVNATAAAHGQRDVDELVGRTMMECYPGIERTELFTTLRRVMKCGKAETLRNEFSYPTGEVRWFDLLIDPVPDGLCILSLDVTDRRIAEMELQHAQRLEAIGQLAGGVAHDFNNQLTAIQGFAELLFETTRDEAVRSDLRAIQEAADRSATLTRQLLAFSRRQTLKVEPIDLNAVVTNVDGLLERVLGESIVRHVRLRAAPALIRADFRQLEHVLANLAINARDAMPLGGRLAITTDIVELTEEDARQQATMAAGCYAVLSVTDTGHGMDEATKARIFEPFFTTKGPLKGTGLGLSSVYGVVKQMSGFIWVYSEPGRGTTFKLYFPTTSDVPRRVPARSRNAVRGRAGTVLVIEDDPGVRDLVIRALSRRGHVTLSASSGEEAERQLRALTVPPDLVLTDVVLPGETGPDLVARLKIPCERALFMSGYADRHIDQPLNAAILEKPFTVRALLAAVDEALTGSGSTRRAERGRRAGGAFAGRG